MNIRDVFGNEVFNMLSDGAVGIVFLGSWVALGFALWKLKQSSSIVLFGGFLGACIFMIPVLSAFGEKAGTKPGTGAAAAAAEEVTFEVGVLNAYGKQLAGEMPNNNTSFIGIIETTPGFYKLTFKTSAESLHSVANAGNDRSASETNAAITELWQEKFCSPLLKQVMKSQAGIVGVTGDLQNMKGVSQRLALCTES